VVGATLGPVGLGSQAGIPWPEVYGLFGATVALTFSYPYVLLPLQAAMARVDPRTWEAARSLGATPVQAFRQVVWPSVRGATVQGALLVSLYTLGDFGAVSLLRFPSLSYLIYARYSSPFTRHEAVWYAFVLVGLALALLAVGRWVAPPQKVDLSQPRPWPTVELGRWRWPAFLWCAGVTGFGAVLPVATVVWWLVRGLRAGNTLEDLRLETFNSVWMAVWAAAAITVFGLLPALLNRFGNPRIAKLVDRACYIGYALPGLVVGLSLIYMGTRAVPWLYHTVWMLQLAYLVRFLPQVTGTVSDSLSAQSPRLYDAARSLGQTASGAIVRVVLPVSAPALMAGALAVFISVVKELPATILLKPPGFSTLATKIWSLTEEAYFTATSPTVLTLLVLALIALWLRPDSALRERREEDT